MRYSAIDAARVWVGEQLRYPQRIPRTTTVLDWSAIPWTLQRRLEDVARASGTIDFGSLPRRRWFSTRSALSASDHTTVASASTMLHWPTHADTDETRIVTLAEGVVDRTASHPAWTIPAVGGRRSVIGLHMELHAIAAAANELLTLRSSTPIRRLRPALRRSPRGMEPSSGPLRAEPFGTQRSRRSTPCRRGRPRPRPLRCRGAENCPAPLRRHTPRRTAPPADGRRGARGRRCAHRRRTARRGRTEPSSAGGLSRHPRLANAAPLRPVARQEESPSQGGIG